MNTKVAKKNNKGFTLIELIVVIAIIAVLAAILAPQYLRYVEKSRVSADASTATEIKNAVQTACANEDVYAGIATGDNVTWAGKGSKGTITANIKDASGKKAMQNELDATLKDVPGMKSKKWQDEVKTYKIDITVDTKNSSVSLKDNAPKS